MENYINTLNKSEYTKAFLEIGKLVEELNNDKSVNGILCQLPLPRHLDEKRVINAISAEKDVDAFHPYNVGKLFEGEPDFTPCTPAGIMELLHTYNEVRPIREEDLLQLKYRFLYPEKFWKIANYYFNNRKSWVPQKNIKKMFSNHDREPRKAEFIKAIF